MSGIDDSRIYQLKNDKIKIAFNQQGNLVELINCQSEHNYAGNAPIWRLFFQQDDKFDLEVDVANSIPVVTVHENYIKLIYKQVLFEYRLLNISVELHIFIDEDDIKFSVKLNNNEPAIIIRDFHYPVIHDLNNKSNQFLITSCHGGMKFDNPVEEIKKHHTQYLAQEQKFIQKKTTYPNNFAATNNFLFADNDEGLYFGLHSENIEITDHNFRLYKNNIINVSMVRFPNCFTGECWEQDGYIVSPYTGSWHVAAEKYRLWAENSWYKTHEIPGWIKQMTGWQRIIMKHQYGEIHYRFNELPQLRKDGERANIDALFMFGWHRGGHDNNYPEYIPDEELGSVEEMVQGISDFNDNEQAVILYSNGQLIDKESKFYQEIGRRISIMDFRGNEISDGYYFQGSGNFYGNFAAQSFVHACPYCEEWEDTLKEIIDSAFEYGCMGVFFDQLGRGSKVCWSPEHNHNVPALSTGIARAKQIKRLREYARSKSSELAVGIEILCDITAIEADFVHTSSGYTETTNDWEQLGEKPHSEYFIDWFRYIFPEIILSDREIRDQTDIERRVNHTVIKGLRNDVEIYRCRRSIAETPFYQEYLGKANALRKKYNTLLLEGVYSDTKFFISTNDEVDARCFLKNDLMAIVVTQSHLENASTTIKVPEYRYVEYDGLNKFEVLPQGQSLKVILGKHGLAVIVLNKI